MNEGYSEWVTKSTPSLWHMCGKITPLGPGYLESVSYSAAKQ